MKKISEYSCSFILMLALAILLLDPMGGLGLKPISLLLAILMMLVFNYPFMFKTYRLLTAFGLFIFSMIFILKQEILFFFDSEMNIIFSTFVLAGLFSLNRSKLCIVTFIRACKLLLLINLIFLFIGVFYIDAALALNLALKKYKMFSLEQRGHHFTDYTFYHNSIYTTVMILPLLIKEIIANDKRTIFTMITLLCVASLLFSQSRTVYLAFSVYLLINYPRSGVPIMVSCLALVSIFGLDLDNSSATKIGYLDEFWMQFDDLKSVWLGTGPLPVHWGNIGTQRFIELTYLELLRYFGVLGYAALLIFGFIFYFGNRKSNLDRSQKQGALIYLSILSVNPYIWGITGLPMLLFFISEGVNDN